MVTFAGQRKRALPSCSLARLFKARRINVPAVGRFPVGTAIEAAGNGVVTLCVRLDAALTVASSLFAVSSQA